ncbi:MAG: methylmalonyl Co-A mutase-associated GTPase MeaB [Thermoleophilia bacterium]
MTGGAVDVRGHVEGVRQGGLAQVSRAITLVESTLPEHRRAAQRMLVELLPHAGGARRVGITGVPGVGKSTFIDALGTHLTAAGHRVAVLAVDPSSTRRGGSILGDKTRMARLATDPAAFIRPSPTAGTLGGVARATREAIVVLEAAGFDVVLVETVGVGQSETAVAGMVDHFLLLMLARSGDSLQGIKKGVLELADVIAVNKADGEHVREAKGAARELADVMRMLQPHTPGWVPPVLTCSALDGTGIEEVWEAVGRHRDALEEAGALAARRAGQEVAWLRAMVADGLLARLREDADVAAVVAEQEARVREGATTAALAAATILERLGS